MPKVSIIIVNWNTGALLTQCIRSLLALPEKASIGAIVVVDNASSDSSLAQLKAAVLENEPLLHILPLTENSGFAQGSNYGAAYAEQLPGLQDSHIFLLNPDTAVKPDVITALLSALQRHPQAAVIGPKLLNSDNSLQPSVRRFPTLSIFILWQLKLSRLLSSSHLWRHYTAADMDYTREQTVDQVMGAAFLIRNTAWQKVGLLDVSFWVWFEEVDYCKRAYAAGWEVLYTPSATVVHHGGASFNQLIGPRRVLPFLRSALHYAHKHLNPLAYVILLLLYPVAVLLSMPSTVAHTVARRQTKKYA